MEKFNEDFIKDTAQQFADLQQFKSDHQYDFKSVETGYIEGFKKALELVKNNGVLGDVSNCKNLDKDFSNALDELVKKTRKTKPDKKF